MKQPLRAISLGVFACLLAACASNSFRGANDAAVGIKTSTGTAGGETPSNDVNTVYIPKGSSIPIPGGAPSCTSAQQSIATCSNSSIVGSQVGSTTVTAPNGTVTKVVVFNQPTANTIYVPAGGTTPNPGSSSATCTTADAKIATCGPGTLSGVDIGNTTATTPGLGTAGTTSGGGTSNVVVYNPNTPPSGVNGDGGQATPPTDAGAATSDGTLIASIPGVVVQRVGINFEDFGPYGDRDYNDSVLCFTGAFKVDSTSVASIAQQTVQVTFSSHSACHHSLDIKVLDQNGAQQSENTIDDAALPPSLPLTFNIGWTLNVTMTSETEPCTDDNGDHPDLVGVHPMSDPNYAIVAPNVCNTTGN